MMAANGANEVTIAGGDEAECSETTVEIKIKTLDSQTYTLKVNKCMSVPALKEQIATVTGVLSEQQRLICRGKVLKDDQLLSAYHVEDGHTLHLVVRQPLHPSSAPTTGGTESAPGNPANDPTSTGAHNRGIAHSVVLGTFNISDQGDGHVPDLHRLIAGVLNSIGFGNGGPTSEGIDVREYGVDRLGQTSGASMSESSQVQTDQAVPRPQPDTLHGAFRIPPAVSMGPLQSAVIPDSLSTLYQYLSHMRREFSADGRNHNNNDHDDDANLHSSSGQGLPTPAVLADIMQLTGQMLTEQAGECLFQVSRQLENQLFENDPVGRTRIQSSSMRSGVLLQNLGALLLELGRTTMTVRMGRTPSEAVVNAGPAVFISRSGPNPLMVQPLPFQPGTSFGAAPLGAVHPGQGMAGSALGSGFLPRNIDIRIRTGPSLSSANANQGEPAGAHQAPGQVDPTINSAGANFIPRSVSGVTGASPFTGESGVRVVPVRTVVATVPATVSHPPSDSPANSVGLFYPLLARFQHLRPGHLNDTSASQVPIGQQQPRHPESADFAPASAASVDFEMRPSAHALAPQQQEPVQMSNSSQEEAPAGNGNHGQESNGQQNGQESRSQMPSRFDQLLRTIFQGEQFHGGDIGLQSRAVDFFAESTGTAREAEQRGPPTDSSMDEAIFFSELMRQVIPFISQHAAIASANASSTRADATVPGTEPDSTTSQTHGDSFNQGSLHRRRGPSSPPSSKRQKRE